MFLWAARETRKLDPVITTAKMLFKYLPAARFDVIQSLKIRFTQASSLNDPFELRQLFYDEKLAAKLASERMEGLDKIWENVPESERTDEAAAFLERTRLKTLRQLERQLSPHAMGEVIMREIDRAFGILSLSRVDDNLLMWSHYADSFAGSVLGLDPAHEFFCGVTPSGENASVRRVTYSSRRQIIFPRDAGFTERLFCEKPLEWAYEQEERSFRYFRDDAPSAGVDPQGNPIFLLDIPPDAVTSLAIGFNASKSDRLAAIETRDEFFPHAPILEAIPSKTHYLVDFRALKKPRKTNKLTGG